MQSFQVVRSIIVNSSTTLDTKIITSSTKTDITSRLRYSTYHEYLVLQTRALTGVFRWEFLGLGFAIENRTPGMDASPYLNEKNLDPKWVDEVINTGALVADREI